MNHSIALMNCKPTHVFCEHPVSESTSAPLAAAVRGYSYPTSLQSVCTSLKLFILTGRSSLTLLHMGRVKAIRLRVWLKAHRNNVHQGADYCTVCIQVSCCWATKLKTCHTWTQPRPPHSFAQIYFVYIWTCVNTILLLLFYKGEKNRV